MTYGRVVYKVNTAAATKAPNNATVEDNWTTPAELSSSVFDGVCGPVVLFGPVVLVWVSFPCARATGAKRAKKAQR